VKSSRVLISIAVLVPSLNCAKESGAGKASCGARGKVCAIGLNLISPLLAAGTTKWGFQRGRASPLVAIGVHTPIAKCQVDYILTSGSAENYGDPNRQIRSEINKILTLTTVANGDERRF